MYLTSWYMFIVQAEPNKGCPPFAHVMATVDRRTWAKAAHTVKRGHVVHEAIANMCHASGYLKMSHEVNCHHCHHSIKSVVAKPCAKIIHKGFLDFDRFWICFFESYLMQSYSHVVASGSFYSIGNEEARQHRAAVGFLTCSTGSQDHNIGYYLEMLQDGNKNTAVCHAWEIPREAANKRRAAEGPAAQWKSHRDCSNDIIMGV